MIKQIQLQEVRNEFSTKISENIFIRQKIPRVNVKNNKFEMRLMRVEYVCYFNAVVLSGLSGVKFFVWLGIV